MKKGRIIKGIAGFYYVSVSGSGIYECRAKGIFRKQNIKPLVGDYVAMEPISEEEKTGNIVDILPRKNALIRPAVANVDQAVVIFALTSPQPNLNLLDRFLVTMEQQQILSVICMNKMDLASTEEMDRIREAYLPTGYPLFFFSALTNEGIEPIRRQLSGKVSTVAGPSGVGKSTLINLLAPYAQMETGEISQKVQRGRHTTRHSELIRIEEDTFIFDTPGFTSLTVEADMSDLFFPEFAPFRGNCRFRGCSHRNEPGCAVKTAVQDGRISQSRYENYLRICQEMSDKKKY
ncbi:MAG: ribosome small subunit-dependent GTPase A [Clostridiales bacterium]|nr:ribosome small subunit-dependent GTPase A [Clostridiales bacterium]